MTRRFEVLLHGGLVGHLSEAADGSVDFRLEDSYREMVPRPVLGQKFEDDLERTYRSRKGQVLPDFFANLIPEAGRLRELIESAAGIEQGDDLGLLAFVGGDLPGAVVVRSSDEFASHERMQRLPLVAPEEDDPEQSLRFSLAGVQLKFSMLLKEEKLTLPGKGMTGDWIVKFDSPSFPGLPENEYSVLSWARHAGFEVPDCQLLKVDNVEGLPRQYADDDSRVLAVKRYDRLPEGRVHQEDLAQAVGLPPSRKYDQVTYELMARLAKQFIDDDAVGEFVRRLVLVVASGNNDAHLKNWSLIYPDRVRAKWSPLYDQVATVAWKAPGRTLSLKLAGAKEFNRLSRADFERLAVKAELHVPTVMDVVDQTLNQLRESWREIGKALPISVAHSRALRAHWRAVPLLREAGFE